MLDILLKYILPSALTAFILFQLIKKQRIVPSEELVQFMKLIVSDLKKAAAITFKNGLGLILVISALGTTSNISKTFLMKAISGQDEKMYMENFVFTGTDFKPPCLGSYAIYTRNYFGDKSKEILEKRFHHDMFHQNWHFALNPFLVVFALWALFKGAKAFSETGETNKYWKWIYLYIGFAFLLSCFTVPVFTSRFYPEHIMEKSWNIISFLLLYFSEIILMPLLICFSLIEVKRLYDGKEFSFEKTVVCINSNLRGIFVFSFFFIFAKLIIYDLHFFVSFIGTLSGGEPVDFKAFHTKTLFFNISYLVFYFLPFLIIFEKRGFFSAIGGSFQFLLKHLLQYISLFFVLKVLNFILTVIFDSIIFSSPGRLLKAGYYLHPLYYVSWNIFALLCFYQFFKKYETAIEGK